MLTGGILTGQSLIRAAELRAVTTEYQQWQTALNTFEEKYFAIPGDMANATTFWGRADAPTTFSGQCANPDSNTGVAPSTCNGNGDGAIALNSSNWNEIWRFWQHLANAKLINGSYTGIIAPTYNSRIGVNVPASKLSNAGWTPRDYNWYGGDGQTYPSATIGGYGNIFEFGAQVTGNITRGAILAPEEVWNIDTKVDDGKPGTGKMIARNKDLCASPSDNASAAIAEYNLNNSDKDCAIIFRDVF